MTTRQRPTHFPFELPLSVTLPTTSFSTKVAVIIPARNEDRFIAMCLDSLLASDYPKELLDVVIVDGDSSDQTRLVVDGYARRYPFVRCISNPLRTTPSSLNIGINATEAEIVVRLDAHATYDSHYI